MAETSMKASFSFFAAIAVIAGVVYYLQRSDVIDFIINPDAMLVIATLAAVAAVWSYVA